MAVQEEAVCTHWCAELPDRPVGQGSCLENKRPLSPAMWLHNSAVQSLSRVCLFLDPMDYSTPGSSVHGIFQTRILEWVAISSTRGSFPPRDTTCASCIGRQILYQ